jgi:hypothetical protein
MGLAVDDPRFEDIAFILGSLKLSLLFSPISSHCQAPALIADVGFRPL